MWRLDNEIQPDGTIHIWPDNDGFVHDLVRYCICGPSVKEFPNGAKMISHTSLDGREILEALDDSL